MENLSKEVEWVVEYQYPNRIADGWHRFQRLHSLEEALAHTVECKREDAHFIPKVRHQSLLFLEYRIVNVRTGEIIWADVLYGN